MKKLVSVLLVLAMLLAVASVAMADCAIKKGMFVEFKKDSTAYTAPRSSKKTNNVVQKGSRAECDKVCGDYARLIVNPATGIKRWFKACDLKETTNNWTRVRWARGGKGMSDDVKEYKSYEPRIKGYYAKVSAHTNLRKSPSLHCKSQGVVEKGTLLKLNGYTGIDNVDVFWFGVCYKGKKLFVCSDFLKHCSDMALKLYDKDGNRVYPFAD